jgi:hypothetical protein
LKQAADDVRAKRICGAFAVGLLVAAGCQQETMPGEAGGSTGPDEEDDDDPREEEEEDESTGAAPFSEEPQCVDYGEPCTECEMAACPELFCGCYGNPECGLLAQCVLACPEGDTACPTACATAFPTGTSTSALLADCAAVNCADACAALGTIPPPLSACERCVYGECGPQMDACVAVDGCPALLVCVAACVGDVLCQSGCAALYPAAIAAAQTVGDCSLAHCSEPCL